MRRVLFLLFTLLLTSCTFQYLDDNGPRSTVYGWIDVDELPRDQLLAVKMRKYAPNITPPLVPVYFMQYEEFQGGYIFWNFQIDSGSYEFVTVNARSCGAIGCSRETEYKFGALGTAPGQVTAGSPDAYYAGNYVFYGEKGNLLERGGFNASRTNGGPSRAQLLDFLIAKSADDPIVNQRLRQAR